MSHLTISPMPKSDFDGQEIFNVLNASRSEIRLLVLPENDPGDEKIISASFRTVSLDDELEYYALSYVWGTPKKSHQVEIRDSKVAITQALHKILHILLGLEGGPACVRGRAIWVDALCINQADHREKEHQIPLMGRIYRQATKVLLYLGDGDEDSDWAMARMNDDGFCESLSTLSATKRVPTLDEIKLRLVLDRNLEERLYWSRVWIMQEMVLPRDPLVLCGHDCIPWARYVNCLQWAPGDAGRYPTVSDAYAELKAQVRSLAPGVASGVSSYMHRTFREAYWELGEDQMSLSALLSATSSLRATDSRDYVFGLLGMLCPEEAGNVEVTYLRSGVDVFKEAIKLVWRHSPAKEWEHFSYHRQPGTLSGLPSWVPDLSSQCDPSCWKEKPGLQLKAASEVWRSMLRPQLIIEGDVLATEAIVFDEIETAEEIDFNYGWEPAMNYDQPYDTMISPLRKAEALSQEGRQRPILDGARLFPFLKMRSCEPVWQTMSYWKRPQSHMPDTTDDLGHESVWKSLVYEDSQQIQLSDLGPLNGLSRVERERELMWEITMERHEIPKAWSMAVPCAAQDDALKVKAAILNPMLHAIRRRSDGRKTFLTKHGFFGIGSRFTQPGDVIVLVYGMQCVRVLRPLRDEYLMVGFAYLSGTKDWQVLDECLDASGVRPEMIKIV